MSNVSINIIKYVAKEIRSRINKNPISITVATDNDDEISRNFWAPLFFHLLAPFRVLLTLSTH